MKVILLDEQIDEIREIVSSIIKDEIENNSVGSTLDNTYLKKKDTCDYLKISNNTLDNWILKGLPVIKIGKTTRFKVSDINNWLKQFENTT